LDLWAEYQECKDDSVECASSERTPVQLHQRGETKAKSRDQDPVEAVAGAVVVVGWLYLSRQ
jgi:hypothetical protein